MTDIKAHCCGADKLFDKKTANKQYKSYIKKGPSRVTKRLISQLERGKASGTLIDVGGGIGAIQWWFLSSGGKQSYAVDASSGYLELAQEHATKLNLSEHTQFILGDFTSEASSLPIVDHVTLDKVICCYPDYKAIIDLACQKAEQTVSFSYPMDGWIANIFRSFMVLFMKLNKNPFKPYIHHVASVRGCIESNGFVLKERELSFPWHVETYSKH